MANEEHAGEQEPPDEMLFECHRGHQIRGPKSLMLTRCPHCHPDESGRNKQN